MSAYIYHALSVDQAIIDVDISTPDDGAGKFHFTILGDGSMEDDILIDKVYRRITHPKVSVLCVTYTASATSKIHYKIHAEITLYKGFHDLPVQKAVYEAIEYYTKNPQRNQSIDDITGIEELNDRYRILGVDIVDSQIIEAIHTVAGVYKADVIGFPADGVIKVLSGDDHPLGSLEKIAQLAVCDSITVNVVGIVDG